MCDVCVCVYVVLKRIKQPANSSMAETFLQSQIGPKKRTLCEEEKRQKETNLQ